MRASGVLLPVSSLPSRYGIGCFSKEAYHFVDTLKVAGQRYWQILPLGPTSYGDSPYQALSTFAGNPYFIDPEELVCEGLLTKEELSGFDFGDDPMYVDYEKLYHAREGILRLAYKRFILDAQYRDFVEKNARWLDDFALYMAIKNSHGGDSWLLWEEPLKLRDPDTLARKRVTLSDEMNFIRFQQFTFFIQWMKLKKYANDAGIKIIGDIPIYVSLDSADTWANTGMFQIDETGLPSAVSGCPPDAFSATGQLWGNPLYRWDYHKKTNYKWWIARLSHNFALFDIVRIDHFRGFDEYYSIPYGNPTAEVGQWKPGPAFDLFRAVKEELGDVPVIAEDLGFLTETVHALLAKTGFPGMKVLQFAFDSREDSDYLPHNYTKNCVVYTGTHDNTTTLAWIKEITEEDRDFALDYMNIADAPEIRAGKYERVCKDMIRLAFASVADTVIVPIQDYLGLGGEARINKPSTLGGNWKWRLLPGQIDEELLIWMKKITKLYGRLPS